jgi:long-chain acyl-CoA synthetase
MNLAQYLDQYRTQSDRVLYTQWTGDRWKDYTAAEMLDLAARWQQAFRDQGFVPGDRVALCLKNGVHWVAADLAALGMGLVVVPLYVNDNAENIAWCANHAEARLLLLENERLVDPLRAASQKLPLLVCLEGGAEKGVASLESWLPRVQQPFQAMDLEPHTLATICYTSGTTGRPKGAMLSHHNIMSNVEACLKVVTLYDDDVMLSIIPLSHMFERTAGYYLPLKRGIRVAYSRSIQQLAEDLATVRPTILLAVPRVYERFLARIEQSLANARLKRALFDRTVELGWKLFHKRGGALDRLQYAVLKRLVAQKIMARLGGRVRLSVVGGAAVELRIAKTFVGLGLLLLQGYGLTEASPVVTANREDDNDPTSAGKPLDGVEIRVNEKQELLVRGPNVMLGYWRDPEATAAIIDRDGWLNTGDQVEMRDGRVYIIGRTKEIVVLSNGEKFPPEHVEAAILNDPIFEQVALVGEGRPYIVMVAVTQETDEKKLIKRANEQLKDFPRYIRVRRVIVEREPWTIENGVLTPTMKLKRREILKRYQAQIERIYASDRLGE